MNELCRLRLCGTTELVVDGLIQIGDEKKNTPPKLALMTVHECSSCHRIRSEFWAEERKKKFREENKHLYE